MAIAANRASLFLSALDADGANTRLPAIGVHAAEGDRGDRGADGESADGDAGDRNDRAENEGMTMVHRWTGKKVGMDVT